MTNTDYANSLVRMNVKSDVALRATLLKATSLRAKSVLYAFVHEADKGGPLPDEAQRVLDVCGRNLGEKYTARMQRIAASNDPLAIDVMLAITTAHSQLRTTLQQSVLRRQAYVLNLLSLAALDDQVTGGTMSIAAFDSPGDAAIVSRIIGTVVAGPSPVIAGSAVIWSCPADLDARTLGSRLDEYVGPLNTTWAKLVMESASLA